MKTMVQLKQFSRIWALLLAFVLVFTLTACGGPDKPGKTDSTKSGTTSSGDGGTTGSDTASGGTSSGATGSGAVSGGSVSSGSTGNGGSTVFPSNPYSPITPELKKKEVHVLMWRPYTPTELSLVNGFTKKTGIKVKTTQTTETQYATKLISLISGKNSPDVLCISSDNFPGFVTRSMLKLDPKVFRLDDPIWNKTYMNAYKVNGYYFSVAINGTWSCEDTSYVTYYNPYVLKDCGITTMPYDLYKQGKWNWDTQRDIATKVYKKSKTYTALALQEPDLFMHSAGVDFVKYDGTKFTNTLGSVKSGDMLVKAWSEAASMNADGLTGGWSTTNFCNGKTGLFSAIAYGLYKEGGWFDAVKTQNGAKGLQAVPVAGPKGYSAYTPIRPKTWGVAKGADNAEGAAYFLRYFLDPSNAKMDNTFYNGQFKEVFNIVTAKNAKKSVKVSRGVIDYINAGSYNKLLGELQNSTAANITSVLNSKKGTVDTGVKKANTDVKKIK